nr:tRNA nucleotidyltransferase [Cytophagales bacterium]
MNFSETIRNHPVLNRIAETAQRASIESYLVGGYVRDLLLNRPSKDIDVVCLG